MQDVTLEVGEAAEKVPGYLLWQVSKLWQRRLNTELHDLHLSSTQAVILINVPRLTQEHKAVTQVMLSAVTKIDRTTTSQSIRTLEQKQLIKRVVPLGNKRAYHVELTDAGSRVAAQALNRIAAAHQTFFRQPEADTDAFVAYMQRLIQANNITEGSNETNN